jgi:hypothetical protein
MLAGTHNSLDSARRREDTAEPERHISAYQQVLLLFIHINHKCDLPHSRTSVACSWISAAASAAG